MRGNNHVIYKYLVSKMRYDGQATYAVDLPWGAEILSVINQRGEITVYASVDPADKLTQVHQIMVVATGEPIKIPYGFQFLGTVYNSDQTLVFHVFYKSPAANDRRPTETPSA